MSFIKDASSAGSKLRLPVEGGCGDEGEVEIGLSTSSRAASSASSFSDCMAEYKTAPPLDRDVYTVSVATLPKLSELMITRGADEANFASAVVEAVR